jgi:hypothetical protein
MLTYTMMQHAVQKLHKDDMASVTQNSTRCNYKVIYLLPSNTLNKTDDTLYFISERNGKQLSEIFPQDLGI